MARPSKGARRSIVLRLPPETVAAIDETRSTDRHEWITDAVDRKLKDENHGEGKAHAR